MTTKDGNWDFFQSLKVQIVCRQNLSVNESLYQVVEINSVLKQLYSPARFSASFDCGTSSSQVVQERLCSLMAQLLLKDGHWTGMTMEDDNLLQYFTTQTGSLSKTT